MIPLTILLVDDDRDIRTLIIEYLGMVGHKVLEAGSGREAIEIIESGKHSIDVAIVDWQMEGISGREVITILRKDLPETKILLATGRGVQDLPESMLSKFACRVLRKPFSMKSLKLEIAGLFQK
tara:strand:+ start:261 stop:632 length:372 start_codon:yes stop_codon:yes gene_type:complete